MMAWCVGEQVAAQADQRQHGFAPHRRPCMRAQIVDRGVDRGQQRRVGGRWRVRVHRAIMVAHAAQLLGLRRTTLVEKLRKYGIEREQAELAG